MNENFKYKYLHDCEHPQIIRNKFTGDYVKVACGKCNACLIKKADKNTTRINFEASKRKFGLFITLTYRNALLPKFYLRPLCDCLTKERNTPTLSHLKMKIFQHPDFVVRNNDPLRDEINYDLINHLAKQEIKSAYKKKRVENLPKDFKPYVISPFYRKSKLYKFDDEFEEEIIYLKEGYYEKFIQQSNKIYRQFPQYKGLCHYVNYKDYQAFSKRLNRRLSYHFKNKLNNEKVDYSSFVCSEYGPKTFLPHFHLLYFSDSRTVIEKIRELLCAAWKYGRVTAELVTGSAGNYCADYLNSTVSLPFVYQKKEFRPRCRFSIHFGKENLQKNIIASIDLRNILTAGISFEYRGKFSAFHAVRTYFASVFPRRYRAVDSSVEFISGLFRKANEVIKGYSKAGYIQINLQNAHKIVKPLPLPSFTSSESAALFFIQNLCRTSSCVDVKSYQRKLYMFFYEMRKYKRLLIRLGSHERVCRFLDYYYTTSDYMKLFQQLQQEAHISRQTGVIDFFHYNKGLCVNPSKDYFKEIDYKEVHYFRVKHKVLNDQNNIFCNE